MTYNELEWKTKDNLKVYAKYWEPELDLKGAVCLVHGLGEHSGRYLHVGEFFSSAGYAFLAADTRGHGKSQGQQGHTPSLQALRDDINILVEQAKTRSPKAPIILYGHSLGGNLVLSYCTRSQPQLRGVISTGPLLRPGFDPPAWKLRLGRMLREVWPSLAMSNGIDRDGLSRDPEVVLAYNTDPLVHDRVSARLGIEMIEEGIWLLENASSLKVPTLLMHGSADRICSPQASREYALEAGDKCTLKIWEGHYHEIHNEPEKSQVLQSMLQWIEEM